MKIALSTDTSCTISKKLATELDIRVFPLNVIVDGEEFLDGISIEQDQLLEAMRSEKSIKTSTPPPGDVIAYFEKIFAEGYDRIIHFTISSKLSSMYQLFSDISRDYFQNRVTVIDSYAVCSLMLSHVLFAYECLQEKMDPEEIKAKIEERKKDNFISFIPENLTALKNGGRISPAIAALGNMIGLKPVLLMKDGELSKDSMTRNVKKTMTEQIETLVGKYDVAKYDYSIVSFDGNEAMIRFIQEMISKTYPSYSVHVFPIAINVCAHCGPGTVGLIITPRIGKKSLNDYI